MLGFRCEDIRNLLCLAGSWGMCDLDLSSSALYAGDSRQYSLTAGFCHSQPVIRRALYRPGPSSRFRRGPLARECPVTGTLPPPAADPLSALSRGSITSDATRVARSARESGERGPLSSNLSASCKVKYRAYRTSRPPVLSSRCCRLV